MGHTMSLEHTISALKDVILTGTALFGAAVAFRGLRTWERQLTGSADYDLARRILRLTYRLRDATNQLRSSVIWAYEMPEPPQNEAQRMSSTQQSYYGLQRAYQVRWQKVSAIWSELQTELLEADVLWGKELQDKFAAVFQLQDKLYVAMKRHLVRVNPDQNEAMKNALGEEQSRDLRILHERLEGGEDDFKQEYAAALQLIEDYLKPHVRRSAPITPHRHVKKS